jgi:hypothetical protein
MRSRSGILAQVTMTQKASMPPDVLRADVLQLGQKRSFVKDELDVKFAQL